MYHQDTIAAIATSSKDGSISVIRISGSQSVSMASGIFFHRGGQPYPLSDCSSHTIHYGYIGPDGDHVMDEVLVLIMRGPRSYTAEDVVEIQCHGGYMICQKILELLMERGARIAEPGEFTKRAFLNGRIDLTQAESVMDLIRAGSDIAWKNSFSQLRGSVRNKIEELRSIILEDTAYLEAGLDDPEHISLEDFSPRIREHTDLLKSELEHLIQNSQNGRLIREGIRTAIIGKPNVGKSSFLNCILRSDRAIVTDIPGTTRDTLEEEIRIGSMLFRFIDTAGIRQTDDLIENMGIQKAKEELEQADLVICIIDSGSELEPEDLYVLEQAKERPGVILYNKIDLPSVTDLEKIPVSADKKIIPFSAVTGEGLEELERYINELFIENRIHYNDEIYITNARQKESLVDALESLCQLWESIEAGMPEDLYTIDLVNAYEALGRIIGETIEDDLADKIFKDFCMGK